MRFFLKPLLFATGAALAVGPALAGALEETPVSPEPEIAVSESDWSGFYAGVTGGLGTASDGVTTFETTMYGAQAGYLFDFGKIVAGAEISYSSAKSSPLFQVESNSVRLKARVGYDAGNVLPYVFAGLSSAQVISSGTTVGPDTASIYGLGVDVAVSKRFRLGVEYLIEQKNNFAGSGFNLTQEEISARINMAF